MMHHIYPTSKHPLPPPCPLQSRAHRFITDNTPCNEHNPLAYLDVSIAGHPGAAGRTVTRDLCAGVGARAREGGGGIGHMCWVRSHWIGVSDADAVSVSASCRLGGFQHNTLRHGRDGGDKLATLGD